MSPLKFILPLVLLLSTSFANAYSIEVNRLEADLYIRFDTLALRPMIVDVMDSFIAERIGRSISLSQIIAGALERLNRLNNVVVIANFFNRLPEATEEEVKAAIDERLETGE